MPTATESYLASPIPHHLQLNSLSRPVPSTHLTGSQSHNRLCKCMSTFAQKYLSVDVIQYDFLGFWSLVVAFVYDNQYKLNNSQIICYGRSWWSSTYLQSKCRCLTCKWQLAFPLISLGVIQRSVVFHEFQWVTDKRKLPIGQCI